MDRYAIAEGADLVIREITFFEVRERRYTCDSEIMAALMAELYNPDTDKIEIENQIGGGF